MREGPDITRIAAMIGDPARASILCALMDGRALTAGELATEAGVTPATASSHLGQLAGAGLVRLRRQGRHRYYALSDDRVATALEALSALAADRGHMRTRVGPREPELREARICYDHLAGALSVRMFRSMAQRGHLLVADEEVSLSSAGAEFVAALGVDLPPLRALRRPLCRLCLDWSERRSHLGGALGAALLDRFLAAGWLSRRQDSRAMALSREGRARLAELFPAES